MEEWCRGSVATSKLSIFCSFMAVSSSEYTVSNNNNNNSNYYYY